MTCNVSCAVMRRLTIACGGIRSTGDAAANADGGGDLRSVARARGGGRTTTTATAREESEDQRLADRAHWRGPSSSLRRRSTTTVAAAGSEARAIRRADPLQCERQSASTLRLHFDYTLSGALVEARALREVSTLKLHPGTPRHSTTPDSWAVAERHKDNMCSDVAWAVYESHTNLISPATGIRG